MPQPAQDALRACGIYCKQTPPHDTYYLEHTITMQDLPTVAMLVPKKAKAELLTGKHIARFRREAALSVDAITLANDAEQEEYCRLNKPRPDKY